MPENIPNPNRAARQAARRLKRRSLRNSPNRPPVAFASREDDRHGIAQNPNAAKRHAAQFDRDSATAKRDGQATQGARFARENGAPLTSRAKRYGYAGTPSLPLTTRGDHYAPRDEMSR